MNTNTLDTLKTQIKNHRAIRFGATDITCDKNQICIRDDYYLQGGDVKSLMETLGIRQNLAKEILDNPSENWPALRNALNTINEQKRFGVIANNDGLVTTILRHAPKEDETLNYDNRIEQLMNSIDAAGRELQNVSFNSEGAELQFNTIASGQIDTGLKNDLWKFGTSVSLTYTSNQFSNYFLRLICSNGMTARENFAYRMVDKTRDVGKQFINFAKDEEFAKSIKPRVQLLKDHRASFAEVHAIANQLDKEQLTEHMPWYFDILNEHMDRGYDLNKMSSKKHRFIYTNENAYDVFNIATDLASHQQDQLGMSVCNALNKYASDMFMKGPQLRFSTVDIYGLN